MALHGCSGPFAARDGQWAVLLAKAGHIVLLPDSFGSRGLGSQCGTKITKREVTSDGLRTQDAIDAAEWLVARLKACDVEVALLTLGNSRMSSV